MSDALGAVGATLGGAVGVALSPLPVIALLLVLVGPRGRSAGPAFLAGWAGGLAVLLVAVLVLDPGGSGSEKGLAAGLLAIVVGLLFWALAVRQVRGRPRPGQPAEPPALLAAVAGMAPGRVVVTAAALATVNPKNLGLTLAAGVEVAGRGLTGAGTAVVVVVFVLVASLSVLAPVGYLLVAGEAARPLLDGVRSWLDAHGWAVMLVLFLVLGAKLVGDGLTTVAVSW
ncbi:GAP family protein [Nocardioides sp. GY 10127]|uniref:GAP family protein n=1 Tax=Nocardioides sp. GY 10127 TaxID=2569762 RepID=UPI0010A91186|nr:GAP family protein [Nocardioides sp. GY 10127]TIC85650.1 GAP family protein [Nocardioides sp. GY 10127]